MSKIFFIIPPEIHFIESYVSKKLQKGREFRQKLGILYVAGYLREVGGIEPRIIDSLADGLDAEDVERIVAQEKPDVVGFSVLTFNLLDCLDIARRVKRVSPNTKVCFGGFHVTLYPKETLNFPEVDYIVFGEGEIPFTNLVKEISKPGEVNYEALSNIPNVGWKTADGTEVVNDQKVKLVEFDDMPLPAHDLLDINKYSMVLSESSRVAAIQTTRGCPAKCTFCDIRLTRYRARSAENVLEEMLKLKELGAAEYFVIDDTFTIRRKRTLDLCKLIIKEKLNIRYKISSRADRLDEEIVHYLAKSGCYRIHIGVETGSQRLLDYLEKGITVDQVFKCFDMCKKAGIETFAYMMVGIPTETREEVLESIRMIGKLRPDHVNYSICTPFPKTKLYEMQLQANPEMVDYWGEFARNPSTDFKIRTINENLDRAELRKLQDYALRKFYTSPTKIVKEIKKTKNFKQFMTKAKIGSRILMPRMDVN